MIDIGDKETFTLSDGTFVPYSDVIAALQEMTIEDPLSCNGILRTCFYTLEERGYIKRENYENG